jgi:acetyltransferase
MAPKGVEFFAGFIRDAQFGPVLSFGLGGIFVELFEEVNFLLLPASERDILSMCRKMKGWEKLKRGFRHLPPVEEKMVVQFLNRFSKWAYEKPSFKEIDLNPIVATQDEVLVVDARIVILNEI